MDNERTWGDGGGRTAPHVIGDISYGLTYGIFVTCLIDGEQLVATSNDGLRRMWDLHRGLTPETIRQSQVRGALATDSEVQEFLKWVENPRYVTHSGGDSVTAPSLNLDDAFLLLKRLRLMQAACTCGSSELVDCPNYIEDDDDRL